MNATNQLSRTWRQYEAGVEWKNRLGLYATVRSNERFYRGDQWRGGGDLPRPVFNVVRRVADYLISSAAPGSVRIRYSDDSCPTAPNTRAAQKTDEAIRALNENAAFRWEHDKMQDLIWRILTDAALSGDGILYCWWDPAAPSAGEWTGDVRTCALDSVNVFPADVTNPDIQSQDYVILSGRSTVGALRAEARDAGVPPEGYVRICADDNTPATLSAGERGSVTQQTEPEDAPVTYLIKFRRENGFVVFEKSTRDCVIRSGKTRCRLYPFANFSWIPTKNCFHGTSPITPITENQKYINRAFAMLIKHMGDTAFSKVIYDRTRIPEWTNEVGEAIAAVGGGNLADAVHLIEPGKLEAGYLEVIEKAIMLTKELSGATETALGNTAPTNTSAILALRESSQASLNSVRSALGRCLEDVAAIWADMLCAFSEGSRPLRTPDGFARLDPDALRGAVLRAAIDVEDGRTLSEAGTLNVLDELLRGGHITFYEYLERIPDGVIPDKAGLLAARTREKSNEGEISE